MAQVGLLRVRIIVLNYNGSEILPLCLPSLVEAARKATYLTMVSVLDNRSTDESLQWVRQNFPSVEQVVAPQNKFLVSFNDYLRTVGEDIVILLNSDIRVEPDFLDPLVRVFEKNSDAFLATPETFDFTGKHYEGGRTHAEIRWGLFWSSAIFPGYELLRKESGPTFASGFGAFHRKRFLELGGYDDLYLPGIAEDADLGFRAWQQGYRSYYVPEARVYHLGQASFKKAFGQKGILTLAHRNAFLFVWKNISDPTLLLGHLLFLIPRLVFACLTGKPELLFGFLKALPRLPQALKRRRSFPKRFRNDRAIFRLANGDPAERPYLFKKRWKRILAFLFDVFCLPLRCLGLIPRTSSRPFSPKKILVIRTDSLGDAALTLPAIQVLRSRFPSTQIDFLVTPPIRELYSCFFPNASFYISEGNGLSIHKQVRGKGYDLAIDFRGDIRTTLSIFFAGIPNRWGRSGTGGSALLTHQIRRPHIQHELLDHLELVSENGGRSPIEYPHFSPVLHTETKLPPGKKIAIHIGAGYSSKRWPTKRFIELTERIREKGLGTPLFVGTIEERHLLDPYRKRLGEECLDLTGRTSSRELLAIIDQAELFIGNDSGPAHLAALLNRKIVVVFSGTNDFHRWAPWSSQVRIVNRPVPCSPCEERICPLPSQVCLEEITVDEVFRAVEEMLER